MDYIAAFSLPQIGIACERARLPHLTSEPFALAAEDGTLTAVSDTARAFRIAAGMPAATARSLCQGLIVLPYDRTAYRQAAEAVWDLLAVESSVVEPVSPELAYLEMTGIDAPQRARDLAETLARHVSTPVFVGLGRSKLVAEHAALTDLSAAPPPADLRLGRSDQNQGGPLLSVVTIQLGQEADALASVPLSRLPMLDLKLQARLKKRGILTLGDVLAVPPHEMQRQFREVGLLLQKLALGRDGDRVRALWPPPRLDETWTFDFEADNRAQIDQALERCASRITATLSRKGEYCRALTISVHLTDGGSIRGWEYMPHPTHDLGDLSRAARRLYGRLPPVEEGITQVTLSATELGVGSGKQLSLLDLSDRLAGLPHERQKSLNDAVGLVRSKYGVRAVLYASLLHKARRLHLWTYPLTRTRRERVRVTTDGSGNPVRFCRRHGRNVQDHAVERVQNRWSETSWNWGEVNERICYRVVAEPDGGLYELSRTGEEWALSATAD